MNLVLIETSGNQHYIFATNKLRENVGASQLTYLAGTQYVIEAVHNANGEPDRKAPQSFAELKNYLLNEQTKSAAVEIIVATSGKAILLVKHDEKEKSKEIAKEIVGSVTKKALSEAPGLSVYGVVKEFDPNVDNLDRVIEHLHEEYEIVRSQLPGPEHRFLRFPFAQACATSGFPASERSEGELRSSVAISKRKAAKDEGPQRMLAITRYSLECTGHSEIAKAVDLPKNLEKFEAAFPKTDWLAVIHADGNGLGQIFLNFGDASRCRDWCGYLKKQREFSLALDDCTINAYGKAVGDLHTHLREEIKRRREAGENISKDEENTVPLLPLVLGGDDLTLICDGRYAIQFAKEFLAEFERQTAANDVINPIADNALGVGRLSSCAGVAIVKPHFPFHAAYDLAEELLQSAKKVKERFKHTVKDKDGEEKEAPYPASALDYHILYDTSGVDLERIRGHLHVDAGGLTHLYARPYLITPKGNLNKFDGDDWLEHHHWENLELLVKAMRKKGDRQDTNRRSLPNSMLHDLREGLFMGREAADARMELVRRRFRDRGFGNLLCTSDADSNRYSLFCSEVIKEDDTEQQVQITSFLDALDIVGFWRD
jgi:hypothetical protein